jgi:uncharacterized protein YdaU (DUF1376 family)
VAVEKAPAFQWYPKDFLSDGNVSSMSLAERGAYITLLCFCWIDGSLPTDVSRLGTMCGAQVKAFAAVWPAVRVCFREQDGRYVNPRLDLEREKQAEHRGQQTQRGSKGAEGRWRKHDPSMTQALPKHPVSNACDMPKHPVSNACDMLSDGSSSSSSTSSSTSVQIRESAAYLYQSAAPAAPTLPTYVGKQRPIPGYRRLRIFRWMLDDIIAMLGDHAEAFDLDKWLLTLDASPGLLPVELWPWIKEQVLEQAAIRGYGAAETGPKKKTATELLIEKIAAGELDR